MRRLFSVAFVFLAVVVGALKIAEWTSENWWMASLGFGGAQQTYWKWRAAAFVPAFGLWWAVMGGNARLAWHNARWRDVSLPLLGPRPPSARGAVSPEDRARLDSLAARGAQGFLILSALLCGVAAANHFDLWLLALHPPVFGADAGGQNASFLVGVWPALMWTWNALGTLSLGTLGLVSGIAAFEGALDFDARGVHIGDATARHLAFCGSLLLLWIGVRCGLSVVGEAVNFGWSPNGVSGFYDRSFADPTRTFFLLSSPVLALWFARAAPGRPLRPLILALGWSFGALFLPLIAPSFGRAVRSGSSSLDATLRAEQAAHIDATRRAWGLAQVEEKGLNVVAGDFLPPVAASSSLAGAQAPREVVAWPLEALRRALAQNDTGEGLNRAPGEVFITREDSSLRAQIIESNSSARTVTSSLALQSDPSRPGTVSATRRPFEAVVMQSPLAPASQNESSGAVSPADVGGVSTPARLRELETQGGVVREHSLMGLALALRFGDRSLLEAGAPVTWHLDPLERAQTLAPFVWWAGARPHPVWVNVAGDSSERLFWLVEGCFTSRSFPGAAMLPSGDEWSGLNYARQSVLSVCDATTGETQFFLFDPNEPFSRAWNALMPGFFRPASELPAPLRAATRLSPALLEAQNLIWTRYHRAPPQNDEVRAWSERSDQWRALLLDTSARATPAQPTLVQRNGRFELEQLTVFAPAGGTVVPASASTSPGATPIVAVLGARDEGESLWRRGGKAQFFAWRSALPLAVPLLDEPARPQFLSPFAPEAFDKRALFVALDERGNCNGLGITHSQAELPTSQNRPTGGARTWSLRTQIASTKAQLPPRSAATETASGNANLAPLRALWKQWKTARAQGRWARVEELEAQINRILTP